MLARLALPAHVVRHSAANAFADMRAIYTWRTWTFGWLGRMLAQVTFFVLLGRVVAGPEHATYLVIGNALMTCVIESLTVVASTTWERTAGTLALLAAAPAGPTWVFLGRSLQWPVSGTGTSLVALFLLGPFFGVTWRPEHIPVAALLVVLTAAGTYCFGLFLAALVLNAGRLRNVVPGVTALLMMAFCGVQVPIGYWPSWIGRIADIVPLTHLLHALRALTEDASSGYVFARAALGLLVGVFWLVMAHLAFESLLHRGRRRGTVDFDP
ncbi:ABC transporter permease [Streptomyces sp. MP131-18]|uniref:ABC transporter permease n=1 Tax=Streptomyces sp. MP131-18 TaxID=1857892 RepID=UPI00097C3209|nr:ABC transporter permease [Streptomyces sp. MP131-18]ONK16048.1 daunorubicin resistance ABC transporter membrane protein [Streptomyces sp. MP131-18]